MAVAKRRASPDIDDQVVALERITELFRAERIVYLCFAVIAFLMLSGCLVVALIQKERDLVSTLGSFGSSGVVAFTSSRVLVMWNKAMTIVIPAGAKDEAGQ